MSAVLTLTVDGMEKGDRLEVEAKPAPVGKSRSVVLWVHNHDGAHGIDLDRDAVDALLGFLDHVGETQAEDES